MKRRVWQFGAGVLSFTTLVCGAASAQDDTAAAGGEAKAEVGGGAAATGAMTLAETPEPAAAPAPPPPPPAAAPADAPAAAAAPGGSDHAQMVGRFAVGYLGFTTMTVGCAGPATCPVDAPVIGMRYWMDEMLGIDVGLGFGLASGGGEQDPGVEANGPSTWAFTLHGGVPLALAHSGHFAFEIVPELNVGFGHWSQDYPSPAEDPSGSGFHLDIGARAGGEVHFGFIGIPELSLQGSIGLAFNTSSTSFDDGTTKTKTHGTTFGTTVQEEPWQIFAGNIAAFYYF